MAGVDGSIVTPVASSLVRDWPARVKATADR